jgi:hypothetical protein
VVVRRHRGPLGGAGEQVASVLEQHGGEAAAQPLGIGHRTDSRPAQVERTVDGTDEGTQ